MASALLLLGQAATEDGLTTEEWLVPLVTAVVGFVGPVVGVVTRKHLRRKTQLEVEAARTRRGRELEQRRADAAKVAENRLVRAVCRLLEGEFEHKRTLDVSAEKHHLWPDAHTVDITLPLP